MPSWNLTTVTPATEYPVSLENIKAHLRIDHDDEDGLLAEYIKAATQQCERLIPGWRTFVATTYRLDLDRFPPGIQPLELPRPPLSSITTVAYADIDNASQTLVEDTDFTTHTSTEQPGYLVPILDSWPETYIETSGVRMQNAVRITFVAGYASVALVPASIKHAIRLLVAQNYENREAVIVGQTATEVPMAVKSLLGANDYGFV